MNSIFHLQTASATTSIQRAYAWAATAADAIAGPRASLRPQHPAGTRPPGLHAVLKVVGTLHRFLYRWSHGRVGRRLRGGPVLLLTTTGRKTGRERTWPVSYVVRGDEFVLVASAGGAARHPAWYLNLRRDPRVRVQVGDSSRTMVARTVAGAERTWLWQRVVDQYPVAAEYQRATGREFPVVVLQPAASAQGDAHGLRDEPWAAWGLANARPAALGTE